MSATHNPATLRDPPDRHFQITDLGPIMDRKIDVTLKLKNHNVRPENVRLGFHVENADGQSVYSSFQFPEIPGGLVKLQPSETRQIRLRHPSPAISMDGNVLWFDVRSLGDEGDPEKILFRTRLIDFHLLDGGRAIAGQLDETGKIFRERNSKVLEAFHPRRDP